MQLPFLFSNKIQNFLETLDDKIDTENPRTSFSLHPLQNLYFCEKDINEKHVDSNENSHSYVLECPYCQWTSSEINIIFEKPTGLNAQLKNFSTESSRKKLFYNRLKAYYEEMHRTLKLHTNNRFEISKLTNIYEKVSKRKTFKNKNELNVFNFNENSRDLQDDYEVIKRMSEIKNLDEIATVKQRSNQLHHIIFKNDLMPIPYLLRTKRSKRCSSCKSILIDPESKPASAKFHTKLIAMNFIPTISLKCFPGSTSNCSIGKLSPNVTNLFLLTVTNPLYEKIKVFLATPQQTLGKYNHNVTILCPEFEVSANRSTHENNSTTKSITKNSTKIPLPGTLWEREKNSTTVVLEIIPSEILPEDKGFNNDLIEISIFVKIRKTKDIYNKNYDIRFKFNFSWGDSFVTVTSVRGHLLEWEFEEKFKKWNTCTPLSLFEAKIVTTINKDMKNIHDNILKESQHAQGLYIWTDCDREGEYIATEIVNVARKANPKIEVKRARFNNLEKTHILKAAHQPFDIDQRQVSAVAARIEFDLRTGSAFTRFQTLSLRDFEPLAKEIISYGSCQFPTLGFVVDRWKRIKNFVSEKFWYIKIHLHNCQTPFNWKRIKLFDRLSVFLIYENCLLFDKAKVKNITRRPKSKLKPYPLTTVELQKQGAKYLGLSSKDIMKIAETLYTKGFISYPRTETDQFDDNINLHSLIEKQINDEQWGSYAQSLLNGKFQHPRKGKNNDKAHAPIHPIAYVKRNVLNSNDEYKVYSFIVKHFLACCSQDAHGEQTTVILQWGDEFFSASGLVVLERNYLDIYIYEKWNSYGSLPDLSEEETIGFDRTEMLEGKTLSPEHLTESELINLMNINGIGTDSTIAEHIQKIVDRKYVFRQLKGNKNNKNKKDKDNKIYEFIPSTLGIALIDGYNKIGFNESLSKPFLRKEMELKLKDICDGKSSKEEFLEDIISQYKALFIKANQKVNILKESVRQYLNI
ncbi:hypothetical protein PORY_000231 [Pneumocystis oryctolagi]|uniref:Uncharacterized protein n=1 Tax=Pneumocystis oryctolagi TaxID=42067 RepID=A0ACB7CGK5_9ASCO|nr:hypothetical protein PORY_000231 [Pneumocystis oryctolagi]